MPRIPNTRPTSIYWLVDVRPETLAKWPNGYPFYCGKTVTSPHRRLIAHHNAAKQFPERKLSHYLRICGDDLRMQIMEVVPPGDDWADRERYWISTIRLLWNTDANIADGGQGVPGYVHTVHARMRISKAFKGRKVTENHRRKISESLKGRIISPKWRENIRRSRLGKSLTNETKEKLSASLKGRSISKETRDKLSVRMKGRIITPEWREKLRQANIGKTVSEETRAKMSAAMRGRRHSDESKRKMSEASKGKPKSREHVENWKRSMQAYYEKRRSENA